MPNPKRRHSKSRTGKRRAHDHLTPANPSACPNCGEPRMPHRVCSKCGYYRGRVAIEMKEEESARFWILDFHGLALRAGDFGLITQPVT